MTSHNTSTQNAPAPAPAAAAVSGEEDDAPPNFFCRPGKGRRKPTRPSDGSGLAAGSSLSAEDNGLDPDSDPPRLAFVNAIVNHHTRAREARHQRARLDASTNAWNMPGPNTTTTTGRKVEDQQPISQHKTQGGGSGNGGQAQVSASTSASSSTANSQATSPSMSSTALPGVGNSGEGPPSTTAHAAASTAPSAPAQEEPPWFSQLASLPHLRSAGIPLLQPAPLPVASSSKRPPASTLGRSRPGSMYGVAGRGSSSTSSHVHAASEGGHAHAAPTSSTSAAAAAASTSTTTVPSHAGRSHSKIPTSQRAQGSTSTPPSSSSPNDAADDNGGETLITLTEEELQPLQPPDNFAMVDSWLYRSSFPKKKHFPFLKTLGLKSVLTLILEEYPDQNTKFLDDEGITFFQFGIPGNKEPFVQIPSDKIASALLTILDKRNHPMLVHCNKGKHRTGCLIGCLRKLQEWSLTTIFDEYRRFSHPKSRSMDQEFIELFDVEMVWAQLSGNTAHTERVWLPRWKVVQDKKREIERRIKDRQRLLEANGAGQRRGE